MYPLLILGVLVCLSACGDKGAGDSAGSASGTLMYRGAERAGDH